MKKLLLAILLLGGTYCQAQTGYTVYQSNQGIRSNLPTTVVEHIYGDTYGVYTVTQGIKSVNPIQIIEPYNGHYAVFNVNQGVRSLNPVYEIENETVAEEVEEEEPVYYTPYIPNVRSSEQIYQQQGQGDAGYYTAPNMNYWRK